MVSETKKKARLAKAPVWFRKIAPWLEKFRWGSEYVGFRLFACVIEVLSARRTARCAENLSWLMMRLPKRWSRYDVAYENLRASFPDYSDVEIDDIIRRMWVHLFRMVAEVIQFPRKLHLRNCRELVVFRQRAAALKAMNSGRPVFILGGHFGTWEASTATFGIFGYPMGVVARKLDNPYLQHWFAAAREKPGHRLLLKQGGFDGMVETLQAGGNLGLLGDQDAGRRGIFVNFFGRPASTFRSIALLAREYNALIVVGYGRRLPDDFQRARWTQFEIGCEVVIDPQQVEADDEIRELTERYTQALERVIRRSPEQYFWVHRRWKSVPGAKRRSRIAKVA